MTSNSKKCPNFTVTVTPVFFDNKLNFSKECLFQKEISSKKHYDKKKQENVIFNTRYCVHKK